MFFLLIFTGIVGGSDVVQDPILWKAQGSSAVMNCIQNKGVSYSLMYWYKQRPGETMKLIVITNAYGEPEFGDVDKNKFDAEKSDPKNGSLTVKDLEPDDSAIYFCSASEHSVSKTGECCTKTVLYKKISDSISQQVAVWYNNILYCITEQLIQVSAKPIRNIPRWNLCQSIDS